MEVNEQQVYEALGVEQPAQEQAPQETQQPQAQPPQGEMSLEQRRENAARRRRAETRAAIQEAVEAERAAELLTKFSCVLQFTAKDVDAATGAPAEDDEGMEDEYPLDDAHLTVGDFMRAHAVDGSFQAAWDESGDAGQCMKRYNLTTMPTVQAAVD